MNNVWIRSAVYFIIAAGQAMLLGIDDTPKTVVQWVKLSISAFVAGAIAVRALFDFNVTLPSEKKDKEISNEKA